MDNMDNKREIVERFYAAIAGDKAIDAVKALRELFQVTGQGVCTCTDCNHAHRVIVTQHLTLRAAKTMVDGLRAWTKADLPELERPYELTRVSRIPA